MEISEQICSLSSRGEKSDSFTSVQPPDTVIKKKKSTKLEKKRRFTDDQIRALELIFESEEKLEPRKKVQIARELGLQPRQIAIWFQNRRARWKAKRTEQDYRKLKVDYDNLLSSFESLKKEKNSLQEELLKLRDVMGGSEPDEARRDNEVIKGSSNHGDGRNVIRWELADRKVSCSSDHEYRLEDKEAMDSRDKNIGYRSLEEKNGPLTLTEKWYSTVDPCGMFDQSGTNSHWLDFWTLN